MKLSLVTSGLVALFASQVAATALTYKLVANEKACFYTKTQHKGEKIAFYFAVRCPAPPVCSCFGMHISLPTGDAVSQSVDNDQ